MSEHQKRKGMINTLAPQPEPVAPTGPQCGWLGKAPCQLLAKRQPEGTQVEGSGPSPSLPGCCPTAGDPTRASGASTPSLGYEEGSPGSANHPSQPWIPGLGMVRLGGWTPTHSLRDGTKGPVLQEPMEGTGKPPREGQGALGIQETDPLLNQTPH